MHNAFDGAAIEVDVPETSITDEDIRCYIVRSWHEGICTLTKVQLVSYYAVEPVNRNHIEMFTTDAIALQHLFYN